MKNTSADIIVFTNGPSDYAPKRILEEASKKRLKAKLIKYADLEIFLTNGEFSSDLPTSKAVFLRGMGEDSGYVPLKYFLVNYYGRTSKVINSKSFSRWPALDKTTQYIEYQKAGIPIVDSYFFGSGEGLLKWGEKAEFPVIAKFNAGSKGMWIYKIENLKELKKVIAGDRDIRTMLFQDFLEGGEDLRIIYLDGKIIGGMKRVAKRGHYLTNFSQGGHVEGYDVTEDKEACRIVEKVAKHFTLDYCGVDLMRGQNGKWKVLEVNRACQFKGFEKATGINVASQIVDYLVK